jgi:hypothetical protein
MMDDVLSRILNGFSTTFLQADRGFIILRAADGSLAPRCTGTRQPGQDETIRISRNTVKHLMDSKEAILSHEVTMKNRAQRI